ncbi:Spc97 / Spc98 family of spindle pole body component, putative isoform 2 [Hibiscus syriacus]|uniref:Gamma-tubulin complex component n=1 Tax=Hibiscus syriacus TaxID=106335 RepID=A0A6A3CWP6_HIBSY|nr:Spc97 / Spc98 family of spindle pole body component, putative isoform 2 [Hibiscus syriacus]
MGVETNFASLFEKLKVEDPWLPPRTWESIPSQSGPLPPLPASQSPISSSSSVSEAILVRLPLNALQGVESSLFSIEKISAAFCSDPADRTFHQTPSLWYRSSSTHGLGKILKSIGCSGFLVFLLQDNQNHGGQKVQEEEGPKYSLVNQVFSVAIGKVLEGYICALDTLYASVNVFLHTKELRTQVEALGNICNLHNLAICFSEYSFEELSYKATLGFHNFFRGGYLLSYLYTQLKVADPAHGALLKFLFLRSREPYCEFIRSWIFKAEINDPYKEFVVEYIASITERNGAAVPCFLKDILVPLVRAGQQLQVLMKLLELHKYVDPGDYTYSDFLPCWSGFAGSNPFYASSITFGKENIEALVLMRNSYYERMEQKLENLLTGLEFNYEQVISHCAEPHFFGTSGGTEDSLTVDLLIRQQKEVSLMPLDVNDFDDSSTKDGSYHETDNFEPFECSSMSSVEEHTESEQLIGHTNNLVWPKQNYFSVLSFSVSTRSEPGGIYEHLSMHLESNWLCAEAESANILPSNGWPVNGARFNAFYIDGDDRDDKRLRHCDSGKQTRKYNTQFFDKFVRHFNESITINNTSAVDLSNEGQLEKESTWGLFQFQQFELTCNGNLLGAFDLRNIRLPVRMMIKQGYGGDVLLIDNSKEVEQRISEIQGLLELSVQRSFCERDHHKDSHSSFGEEWTAFVDNLSKRVSRRAVKELFQHQGNVLRVYIPNVSNKPKYRNQTFAFVQFEKEEGLKNAIENVNGAWIDGMRVTVGVAKYQSHRNRIAAANRSQTESEKSNRGEERKKRGGGATVNSLRDGRSYKEALVSNERRRKEPVLKEQREGSSRRVPGLRNMWEMHIPSGESDWVKSSLIGFQTLIPYSAATAVWPSISQPFKLAASLTVAVIGARQAKIKEQKKKKRKDREKFETEKKERRKKSFTSSSNHHREPRCDLLRSQLAPYLKVKPSPLLGWLGLEYSGFWGFDSLRFLGERDEATPHGHRSTVAGEFWVLCLLERRVEKKEG